MTPPHSLPAFLRPTPGTTAAVIFICSGGA
jgi:hypothetical protein